MEGEVRVRRVYELEAEMPGRELKDGPGGKDEVDGLGLLLVGS